MIAGVIISYVRYNQNQDASKNENTANSNSSSPDVAIPEPIEWEENEEIKIFREYLQIPSVHPDIDYGNLCA